jgi:hypothetical protein
VPRIEPRISACQAGAIPPSHIWAVLKSIRWLPLSSLINLHILTCVWSNQIQASFLVFFSSSFFVFLFISLTILLFLTVYFLLFTVSLIWYLRFDWCSLITLSTFSFLYKKPTKANTTVKIVYSLLKWLSCFPASKTLAQLRWHYVIFPFENS